MLQNRSFDSGFASAQDDTMGGGFASAQDDMFGDDACGDGKA